VRGTHTVEDWSAHRHTDTQTHKSENSISASFTPFNNKLTFDPPIRLPELTLNLIRSSRGHSTPSLTISCKSVEPFSRNLADKETNKYRVNK